jgi:hypothetical protein
MDPAVIHSLTGLLVPLGGMVSLIAIIVLVLDFRHRRTQQLHETVTRLAEKGLPVPPELLSPPLPKSRLRGALTLVGLGLGLIALFIAQGDSSNWGVGAVPLAIGLAQLVAWKLENGQSDKPSGS